MLVREEEELLKRHVRYAAVLSRLLQARPFGAIAAIIVLGVVFQSMSGAFLTSGEMAGIFTVAAPLGITGVGSPSSDLRRVSTYRLGPCLPSRRS